MKENLNIYIEYLRNIQSINLIIAHKQRRIKETKCEETRVEIEFDDQSEHIRVDFDDSKLSKLSFINSKTNFMTKQGYFETAFRFKIELNEKNTSNILLKKPSKLDAINELFELRCLMCKQSILKKQDQNQRFVVLPMPENDMDELADNFFCHLHDHDHFEGNTHHDHVHHEAVDINALNPLRDIQKQRKSVLDNLNILVLSDTHLNLEQVEIDEASELKCKSCSFKIGHKQKRDQKCYLIWKSNVLFNENKMPFDLFQLLTQGRYLIESQSQKVGYSIYLCVLSDQTFFKHIETHSDRIQYKIKLCINELNCSKKVMYKVLSTKCTDENENLLFNPKTLHNDVNVSSVYVSDEQLRNMMEFLNESNSKLTETLQSSNGFSFAII